MKKTPLIIFLSVVTLPFTLCAQSVVTLSNGFTNDVFLASNQKDIYQIKLSHGEFLDMILLQKGVDVVIDAYDPAGKKLKTFDSPNGADGSEPIQLVAASSGNYRLDVHGFNDHTGLSDSVFAEMMKTNQGRYGITSVQILSAKQYKQKLAEEKAAEKKTIAWISANAIPLKSVAAGNGFDDLQPLKPILKDVKYVGLGEATHGTSEFFQMKHRMLEFLVKEMGFTVFAMEASFSGCRNINDYVLYGKGDAHTALASQGFWTWDTKEVIDMIEWMRQYNQTVPDEKKVKFMGFDIQSNSKGGGIGRIESYLQKVDTLQFKEMKPFLDSIESSLNSKPSDSIRSEYMNFLSLFLMSKGNYIQKSSAQEYETALEYVRTLGQYVDVFLMDPNDPRRREHEWRDYYMASNFMSFVEQEKPGTKFVIWAHNGHVSHNPGGFINGGVHPFGSYLEDAYGDAYYAFGFAFNKGSFQAIEMDSLGNYNGLQEFTVNPAKEKSLDWYYAQINQPMFIINFRSSTLPDYMKAFCAQPHDSRGTGAVASKQTAEQAYGPYWLPLDFDGMIFINETHRSQPTETGMRKASK